MNGFKETRKADCPLLTLGVGAVDRAQQVMSPSDAAHTEGAFLSALSECFGSYSVSGLCLVDNPDGMGSENLLIQYAELFESAVAIGTHQSNEGVHSVPPHTRYSVRT